MRVAVVGAGIVGACATWELVGRGADVLVFDAAGPGHGVSGWSFAWANASSETTDRRYFDLRVAALAAWRDLASRVGGGWWHPVGHLSWGAAGRAAGTVEHLRSWGYPAEVWPAERVQQELEPVVAFPGPGTEVAFFPGEGWIDGPGAVYRLLHGAVRRGAVVHVGQPVDEVALEGGRVVGLAVAGGERHAVDAVVNAAGPAAARVAALVGRVLPLRDAPGVIARLACERAPVHRSLHAPGVELRPDGERGVVAHSLDVDARIGPSVPVAELAHELRRRAVAVVPALAASDVHAASVAWRPMPVDGHPSVGGLDDIGGYYESVMHSGVTLAAVVGRCLAREVVDGSVDELVRPYRPGRFV